MTVQFSHRSGWLPTHLASIQKHGLVLNLPFQSRKISITPATPSHGSGLHTWAAPIALLAVGIITCSLLCPSGAVHKIKERVLKALPPLPSYGHAHEGKTATE